MLLQLDYFKNASKHLHFFLFWVQMNIYKDWKAELESAYSFILKYSKITVWLPMIFVGHILLHKRIRKLADSLLHCIT